MRKASGFTLIELMITVVVVAILAAIAVPSYIQYIQRGKITEATSSLSGLRLTAEKWFADNRTYVGFSQVVQDAKYFTYACDDGAGGAVSATAYRCIATGIGGMTGFQYTINQSNVRTSTFTSPVTGWSNSSTCWVTKKGESC
jgi:type IV pilus assembly protein PilE